MRSFVNRDAQRPACRGPRTHALPAARATRGVHARGPRREGGVAPGVLGPGIASRRRAMVPWRVARDGASRLRRAFLDGLEGSRARGADARVVARRAANVRSRWYETSVAPARTWSVASRPLARSPLLPPSSRGVACTAFLRDGDLAAADTGAPAPGEHDDEAGKSPRRHFTDRMKSAIDEGDHASALAAFDDMAQLYPDNQGVLAYELLIKLAARAGDPDAAVEALEAMLTVGYAPRVHTHGKIILACNRAGDLRRGADWLDMLLEAESPDFARRKSARLFDKVLLGAAMQADEGVFHEAWAKMRAVEAVPTEGTLEAFLLMESKIGISPSVEAVWSHDAFAHLRKPRSPKLHLRRVEAHARVATYLIRSRDASRGGRGGGKGRDASVVGADVRAAVHDANRDARAAAAEARRFADAALDELYARVGEATSFTTKVSKPKDVRDATTTVCGAYSVVGDSNRVRELMERASAVGVEPDLHVFNALLRSEAADRDDDGVGEDVPNELDANDSYDEYADRFSDSHDSDASASPTRRGSSAHHNPEVQRAVIRVEEMMRDMVESGVEPDLHSFMALLTAYAKAGDVSASADALEGMRERDIPLDTWAFNALLQACAVACDLESAVKIRGQMRAMGVPPDDITFLHLFNACAKRSRQVATAYRDVDDWDDWEEWGGAETPGIGGKAAMSHAALAGALVSATGGTRVGGVGDAARAAARAAAEGFASVRDVFAGGGADGFAEGERARDGDDGGSTSGSGSGYGSGAAPELARARAALTSFREDMRESGVAYTSKCATATMRALGSLREFDEMMAFLRSPPSRVVPDVYMYTQAMHMLAQDPFHWQRDARGTNTERSTAGRNLGVKTGPVAALALADEMESRGVAATRVTLNCALLACAQLRDFGEASRRFESHVARSGDVGADTFNCLFKAAWASGSFAQNAEAIARRMEDAGVAPNAYTELTLRSAGGSGGSYSAERSVSDELLIRFGFDPEHEPETPWMPMAERDGYETREREEERTTEEDDANEDDPPEEKGARRWNRRERRE